MKKLLKAVILISVALFILTGCNQSEEEDEPVEDVVEETEDQTGDEGGESQTQADEETISLAEEFIEQLSEEQYEEAAEKLDETMAEQLGPEELQELWASLEEQLGDFLGYEYSGTESVDDYQVILISGVFNDADATFQVTVSENLEIAGFYIQ